MQHQNKGSVRFWFFWNGSWVKLSLKRDFEQDAEDEDDNAIYLYHAEPNEEGGYDVVYETFWLRGGIVYRRRDTRSKDCDGRMETSDSWVCPINQLRSREPYSQEETYCPVSGAMLPNWQDRFSRQRDHFAEAMGY